jgi:hypothetical protein
MLLRSLTPSDSLAKGPRVAACCETGRRDAGTTSAYTFLEMELAVLEVQFHAAAGLVRRGSPVGRRGQQLR